MKRNKPIARRFPFESSRSHVSEDTRDQYSSLPFDLRDGEEMEEEVADEVVPGFYTGRDTASTSVHRTPLRTTTTTTTTRVTRHGSRQERIVTPSSSPGVVAADVLADCSVLTHDVSTSTPQANRRVDSRAPSEKRNDRRYHHSVVSTSFYDETSILCGQPQLDSSRLPRTSVAPQKRTDVSTSLSSWTPTKSTAAYAPPPPSRELGAPQCWVGLHHYPHRRKDPSSIHGGQLSIQKSTLHTPGGDDDDSDNDNDNDDGESELVIEQEAWEAEKRALWRRQRQLEDAQDAARVRASVRGFGEQQQQQQLQQQPRQRQKPVHASSSLSSYSAAEGKANASSSPSVRAPNAVLSAFSRHVQTQTKTETTAAATATRPTPQPSGPTRFTVHQKEAAVHVHPYAHLFQGPSTFGASSDADDAPEARLDSHPPQATDEASLKVTADRTHVAAASSHPEPSLKESANADDDANALVRETLDTQGNMIDYLRDRIRQVEKVNKSLLRDKQRQEASREARDDEDRRARRAPGTTSPPQQPQQPQQSQQSLVLQADEIEKNILEKLVRALIPVTAPEPAPPLPQQQQPQPQPHQEVNITVSGFADKDDRNSAVRVHVSTPPADPVALTDASTVVPESASGAQSAPARESRISRRKAATQAAVEQRKRQVTVRDKGQQHNGGDVYLKVSRTSSSSSSSSSASSSVASGAVPGTSLTHASVHIHLDPFDEPSPNSQPRAKHTVNAGTQHVSGAAKSKEVTRTQPRTSTSTQTAGLASSPRSPRSPHASRYATSDTVTQTVLASVVHRYLATLPVAAPSDGGDPASHPYVTQSKPSPPSPSSSPSDVTSSASSSSPLERDAAVNRAVQRYTTTQASHPSSSRPGAYRSLFARPAPPQVTSRPAPKTKFKRAPRTRKEASHVSSRSPPPTDASPERSSAGGQSVSLTVSSPSQQQQDTSSHAESTQRAPAAEAVATVHVAASSRFRVPTEPRPGPRAPPAASSEPLLHELTRQKPAVPKKVTGEATTKTTNKTKKKNDEHRGAAAAVAKDVSREANDIDDDLEVVAARTWTFRDDAAVLAKVAQHALQAARASSARTPAASLDDGDAPAVASHRVPSTLSVDGSHLETPASIESLHLDPLLAETSPHAAVTPSHGHSHHSDDGEESVGATDADSELVSASANAAPPLPQTVLGEPHHPTSDNVSGGAHDVNEPSSLPLPPPPPPPLPQQPASPSPSPPPQLWSIAVGTDDLTTAQADVKSGTGHDTSPHATYFLGQSFASTMGSAAPTILLAGGGTSTRRTTTRRAQQTQTRYTNVYPPLTPDVFVTAPAPNTAGSASFTHDPSGSNAAAAAASASPLSQRTSVIELHTESDYNPHVVARLRRYCRTLESSRQTLLKEVNETAATIASTTTPSQHHQHNSVLGTSGVSVTSGRGSSRAMRECWGSTRAARYFRSPYPDPEVDATLHDDDDDHEDDDDDDDDTGNGVDEGVAAADDEGRASHHGRSHASGNSFSMLSGHATAAAGVTAAPGVVLSPALHAAIGTRIVLNEDGHGGVTKTVVDESLLDEKTDKSSSKRAGGEYLSFSATATTGASTRRQRPGVLRSPSPLTAPLRAGRPGTASATSSMTSYPAPSASYKPLSGRLSSSTGAVPPAPTPATATAKTTTVGPDQERTPAMTAFSPFPSDLSGSHGRARQRSDTLTSSTRPTRRTTLAGRDSTRVPSFTTTNNNNEDNDDDEDNRASTPVRPRAGVAAAAASAAATSVNASPVLRASQHGSLGRSSGRGDRTTASSLLSSPSQSREEARWLWSARRARQDWAPKSSVNTSLSSGGGAGGVFSSGAFSERGARVASPHVDVDDDKDADDDDDETNRVTVVSGDHDDRAGGRVWAQDNSPLPRAPPEDSQARWANSTSPSSVRHESLSSVQVSADTTLLSHVLPASPAENDDGVSAPAVVIKPVAAAASRTASPPRQRSETVSPSAKSTVVPPRESGDAQRPRFHVRSPHSSTPVASQASSVTTLPAEARRGIPRFAPPHHPHAQPQQQEQEIVVAKIPGALSRDGKPTSARVLTSPPREERPRYNDVHSTASDSRSRDLETEFFNDDGGGSGAAFPQDDAALYTTADAYEGERSSEYATAVADELTPAQEIDTDGTDLEGSFAASDVDAPEAAGGMEKPAGKRISLDEAEPFDEVVDSRAQTAPPQPPPPPPLYPVSAQSASTTSASRAQARGPGRANSNEHLVSSTRSSFVATPADELNSRRASTLLDHGDGELDNDDASGLVQSPFTRPTSIASATLRTGPYRSFTDVVEQAQRRSSFTLSGHADETTEASSSRASRGARLVSPSPDNNENDNDDDDDRAHTFDEPSQDVDVDADVTEQVDQPDAADLPLEPDLDLPSPHNTTAPPRDGSREPTVARADSAKRDYDDQDEDEDDYDIDIPVPVRLDSVAPTSRSRLSGVASPHSLLSNLSFHSAHSQDSSSVFTM